MSCYQILDLVISGIAAVGTIGAAIVALYLANRQDKLILRVAVYKAVTISARTPCPESVAISIINRSKFSVLIDGIGWTLPKSPRGLCMMLNPGWLMSNGMNGAQFPFTIESGGKAPLFSMPWEDFETSLHHMASRDIDGVYHHEIRKKRIKFYISTPRSDRNLLFDIGKDVMDAFVESLKHKDKKDGNQ